jgi:YVTN family beta-propeller protein
MKRVTLSFVFVLLAVVAVAGLHSSDVAYAEQGQQPARGKIVVANRASASISVIDTKSDELVGTFDLPAGDNTPEPMYVVDGSAKNRVFVGDRANDRVVVFDARDFSIEATVPTGAGVFHMWADPQNKQLWVNNDIDNTSTVINPNTLEVIATVPTPEDLVELGGKPHDVILDPGGNYAYVTVLGVDGPYDYVVQFSTDTFEEVGRAAVGKDPHVSLARQNNLLYVPCQGSDVVFVLNRETLAEVIQISVPGAHGAGMTRNGKTFYTTNITNVPDGDDEGLFAIDTTTNTIIDGGVDTPFAVPHNIALTPNGQKLYVTHSGGSADKVTIYTAKANDPVPVFLTEVTVGLNPFGLAYIQ